MGVLKSFLAFLLGLFALIVCYNYISAPVVVCACFYIPGRLFLNKHYAPKSRIFFIILLGIIGVYFYSFNVFCSIKYYPDYGNILAIIFDITNVLAIISAAGTMSILHLTELKQLEQNKHYED